MGGHHCFSALHTTAAFSKIRVIRLGSSFSLLSACSSFYSSHHQPPPPQPPATSTNLQRHPATAINVHRNLREPPRSSIQHNIQQPPVHCRSLPNRPSPGKGSHLDSVPYLSSFLFHLFHHCPCSAVWNGLGTIACAMAVSWAALVAVMLVVLLGNYFVMNASSGVPVPHQEDMLPGQSTACRSCNGFSRCYWFGLPT